MPPITILEQNQNCCLSFFDFRSSFEKSKPPFLFIFSRNDAVSLLKAAAKGGSRHEAHTISTKSDGHWHIKKSPTTTGGNYACIYELSNHLNTTHNTNAPVRAFRTGAFCCSKNFLKKFQKIFGVFENRRIAPRKGGSTTNFPTRKEVRMWNLIAGSFRSLCIAPSRLQADSLEWG